MQSYILKQHIVLYTLTQVAAGLWSYSEPIAVKTDVSPAVAEACLAGCTALIRHEARPVGPAASSPTDTVVR